MNRRGLAIFYAACSALALLMLSEVCTAQISGDFKGKTITIISGFAPGGDYDLYARLVAAHMGRYLKGNPAIVVRNMTGAGGMIGANYLYEVAPHDGSVLGIVPQTVGIAQTVGKPNVKYDVTKFNWIGRINSNVEVQQVWRTSAVKTIGDARTYEVTVAGTGPDSSSVVFPTLLNRMFGMKFKVVPGYEGVNMATLALERGEVESATRPWALTKSVHPEWMKEKLVNTIVQYAVQRHHELPDVPAVVDLAENDVQRLILSLYASGRDIGRSIVAPPGVPQAIIEGERVAFDATLHDPDFVRDINNSQLATDFLSGADLQEVARKVVNISPEIVIAARAYSEPEQ